jgi:hypothetical protein
MLGKLFTTDPHLQPSNSLLNQETISELKWQMLKAPDSKVEKKKSSFLLF